MKNREAGFTLFEVLVSMFITGVALLGLAMMDVYILKSSQSSFNYTVATIRANSFVDAVWMDLCKAQSSATNTYSNARKAWIDELSTARMTADATVFSSTSSAQKSSVTVSWSDKRFSESVTTENKNNTLSLEAKFPDSGCG